MSTTKTTKTSSTKKVVYEDPKKKTRPKLLLPNRVKQFEAGRIRPCAECAYCVPVDEVNGECRRFAPGVSITGGGKGYCFPVVPFNNCFCGVFLNRDAALWDSEGGDAGEGDAQ